MLICARSLRSKINRIACTTAALICPRPWQSTPTQNAPPPAAASKASSDATDWGGTGKVWQGIFGHRATQGRPRKYCGERTPRTFQTGILHPHGPLRQFTDGIRRNQFRINRRPHIMPYGFPSGVLDLLPHILWRGQHQDGSMSAKIHAPSSNSDSSTGPPTTPIAHEKFHWLALHPPASSPRQHPTTSKCLRLTSNCPRK